jgi:hypothetical protein
MSAKRERGLTGVAPAKIVYSLPDAGETPALPVKDVVSLDGNRYSPDSHRSDTS